MKGDGMERKGFRNAACNLLEDSKAHGLNRTVRIQIRHHPRLGALRRSRTGYSRKPLQVRPALEHARNARDAFNSGDRLDGAPFKASRRVREHKVHSWLAETCCEKGPVDPTDYITQRFLSTSGKGRKHRDQHFSGPSGGRH